MLEKNYTNLVNFQTLLFVDEVTLRGARKQIYILLKVMKFLTDAPVTSYKIKYAIHNTFLNKEPVVDGIGNSLKKVMNHQWIRGCFESVRKELKELGIEKIIPGRDSLDFVGISEPINT